MRLQKSRLFSQTVTVLFFLSTLVILFIPFKNPFNFFDEGFTVFNATRIMNGGIPYKDFWTIYPPGQFYILAFLFKMFGTSLLVSRLYDTFVRFIIVILVWRIARKITTKNIALFTTIATAILLGTFGYYSYVVIPAMAFSLFAVLLTLKYLESSQRWKLFLIGLLIGVTFFIRWDFGLYTGISSASAILLSRIFGNQRNISIKNQATTCFADLAILVGVAAGLVLISYGYVISKSGFGYLWDQIVMYPTSLAHLERGLPYPGLFAPISILHNLQINGLESSYYDFLGWLRFYFSLTIYIIAISLLLYSIIKKRLVFNINQVGKITIGILGMLYFAQAWERYGYTHIFPTSIVAFLLGASFLSLDILNRIKPIFKKLLVIFLVEIIALYAVLPFKISLQNYMLLGCYSRITRASCVPLSGVDGEEPAIAYIDANSAQSDPIFVGNQRNDRIIVNDIGFYFLANRINASRYTQLEPGIATTLPAQEEIVQNIASKKVRWIVLVNIPVDTEPNESALSTGITYLDDFIRANYHLAAEFGNYQIMELISK